MSKAYDQANDAVQAAADLQQDAIADLIEHYAADEHADCDFIEALATATEAYFSAFRTWDQLHDAQGAPAGTVLQ